MRILMTNFTKMVGDSGGVAKVACAFANEMVERGHEVSIIHSDEKDGEFFFSINKQVKVFNAKKNIDGSIIKFPVYMKALREILRPINKRKAQLLNRDFDEKYLLKNIKRYIDFVDPEVIVSFQPEGSIFLLYNLKLTIPVLTMSHGHQKDEFDEKEKYALEHSKIYQLLVPSFEKHINIVLPNVKTITIGNAIPQFDFCADLEREKEQYKIVFVGRLTKNHKRPHLLIQAFAKIAENYPNWIVELWGAKDRDTYYAELEHYIKTNSLQNRVFLKGTTSNVPEVLKNADVYAFPSAYEGFPLALGEAMSAGLPAIGYRSCPAVNEIIIDGKTGILCDDGVEALAEGLEELLKNKEKRIEMGKNSKQEMSNFAPDRIWNIWESLLSKNKYGSK